jgi:Mg2+ and Co2+ transporter CorA
MQIHEPNNFKIETPFVMNMDFDHKQDFTPAYVEPPFVFKDTTPIPKKRFFRQLLDLPKDIQELKTSQRSANESIQEVERDVSQVGFRVDESERKLNDVKDQIDTLSKRSTTYQDRVENLSSSVNPLVTQVAELKMQNQKIQDLSRSLNVTKIVMGFLVVSNLVLLGILLKPLLF